MANKDQDNKSGDATADGEHEEFVIVETDDKGVPLNGGAAAEEESDDDDDEEEREDAATESEERGVGHDASRENESDDERRTRRQRERRTKRIRSKVVATAKDKHINALTHAVHSLTEEVQTLKGRTVQHDENMLRGQLQTIENQLAEARDTMARCVKANDGDGVAEVTEIQYQLRDQKRNLELSLNRARQAREQGAAAGAQRDGQQQQRGTAERTPELSPKVIRNAAKWAGQNDWYDPNGGDKDSRRVVRIDADLTADGYDPEDQDYWDELSERVREELPHKFKDKANGNGSRSTQRNNESNNGAASNGAARKNGGPRMASSQSGPRKLRQNEVYITPERKKAMQEAGMWDDVKKRNEMLKSYHDYDRSNQN